MTDGIIQKVLQPYIESKYLTYMECRNQDTNSTYTENAKISLDKILKLQQELIEEIKKSLDGWDSEISENLRMELIGDNQ